MPNNDDMDSTTKHRKKLDAMLYGLKRGAAAGVLAGMISVSSHVKPYAYKDRSSTRTTHCAIVLVAAAVTEYYEKTRLKSLLRDDSEERK